MKFLYLSINYCYHCIFEGEIFKNLFSVNLDLSKIGIAITVEFSDRYQVLLFLFFQQRKGAIFKKFHSITLLK
jgi:hypothetical protein